MREAFVIAKREFLERVRSKWFLVMTLLWPLLMVAMIVAPALLAGAGSAGAKVEIVDQTGKLGEPLALALGGERIGWKAHVMPADTPEQALRDRVHARDINGYVLIPKDALDGGTVLYRGDNGSNTMVQANFAQAATGTIIMVRAAQQCTDPAKLLGNIDVKSEHSTGEATTMSGLASFFVGYAIAFILYIAITLYGINVMRSVVVEKSSRVIELLVAATKPRAMMAGKIAGVGAAGLLQIAIWLVIGAVALANKSALLGVFGIAGNASGLPALTAVQVVVVLLFFVAGFLFYSAMYAAVGAMVSSDQDSQQAQMPVTMFLVVGIVCMNLVTNDPRGSTTAVMTMVPFWSPMLMPMRYFLGGATLGEVGLSFGVLAVSTYLVARAAAKIYRVGILMYGKRPSLRELLRWLRH